jgi:hypothetical protein
LTEIRNSNVDDKKFVETANKVISLKPNFFGIGFDINELINSFIKK